MGTTAAASCRVLKAALISAALGKQYCVLCLLSWQVGGSLEASIVLLHSYSTDQEASVSVIPAVKYINLNSRTGEMSVNHWDQWDSEDEM